LRIVDYELSGNNDACFDLGNTAPEASFDDALRAACARRTSVVWTGGSWPG